MAIPYIKKAGTKAVLIVHDSPYIMLAGEVHNSNASSVEYMEQVWEKAQALNMNTLLLPISWELVEPQENIFDFAIVDDLIAQARKRRGKLVLLWFGAWKNAQCTYAPEWVKTDLVRFKRAEVEKGKRRVYRKELHGMPYSTLSYLCEETCAADAKAFRGLMAHIKKVDEKENTVLMVQVENEPGLRAEGRERSDIADELFYKPVPQDFVDHMRASTEMMVSDVAKAIRAGADKGDWNQVFGEVAEEIFSAYHTANYINTVASGGKEEYPLPFFANCWLDKGDKPGIYPSGGPVSRVHEVWKYCAPSIDILCPDIYVPDFCGVCDEYTRRGYALFIPETATHSYAGPRAVYVTGHYHALGYAPFGFEDMGCPFTFTQGYLFGMDTTDPALKTPQDIEEYALYNKMLNGMMPLLTEKYGTESLQAVICERKEQDSMEFGNFGIKAIFEHPFIAKKDGVCLALQVSDNEFFIIANRCGISPYSIDASEPHVELLLLEEGYFAENQWQMIRRLNGDEAMVMCFEKPTLLRMKVFSYADL